MKIKNICMQFHFLCFNFLKNLKISVWNITYQRSDIALEKEWNLRPLQYTKHIYMEFRKMLMITLYAEQKKRHRCIEQSFRLCGRRRGWDVSREQHWNVYYLGWNRSPAQVGCMRQALGPGALGRPRGIRWRGRWVGGSGWGTHVNPWLFHFSVWQNPLQYKK